MSVSFIIPTKNEEMWLPTTLSTLLEAAGPTEIIVADNESADRTREIASAAGCRVIPGGLPAHGRNLGARAADGSYLFFVDADVKLSRAAFVAGLQHMQKGAAGVFYRYDPDTESWIIRFAYFAAHVYFIALARLGVIRGMGPVIIANRESFEKCGGFPEETAAAEDVEFIRRLSRVGTIIYERRHRIVISARRFRAEGIGVVMAKALLWGVARGFGLKGSFFRYRWHDYEPKHKDPTRSW